jgi:hypothetical protein
VFAQYDEYYWLDSDSWLENNSFTGVNEGALITALNDDDIFALYSQSYDGTIESLNTSFVSNEQIVFVNTSVNSGQSQGASLTASSSLNATINSGQAQGSSLTVALSVNATFVSGQSQTALLTAASAGSLNTTVFSGQSQGTSLTAQSSLNATLGSGQAQSLNITALASLFAVLGSGQAQEVNLTALTNSGATIASGQSQTAFVAGTVATTVNATILSGQGQSALIAALSNLSEITYPVAIVKRKSKQGKGIGGARWQRYEIEDLKAEVITKPVNTQAIADVKAKQSKQAYSDYVDLIKGVRQATNVEAELQSRLAAQIAAQQADDDYEIASVIAAML